MSDEKDSVKAENKEEPVKASKLNLELNNSVLLLVAVVLIGGIVVGFVANMLMNPVGTVPVGSDVDAEALPLTELEGKVADYLNDNFFGEQDLSARVTGLEPVEGVDDLYLIRFDILEDGEVLQENAEEITPLYSTSDGKGLLIGSVLNLNEPLEIPGETDGENGDEAELLRVELDPLEQTEVPSVELFVMSHCPYGTQMEKGIIPVIKLLGDEIDFELKFVDYAMHMQKELDEQLNQYCVQREYPDKLIEYLECFLVDEEKGAECIQETGLDAETIASCAAEVDEEFAITADFEDPSKANWVGNYPQFNVHHEDNELYGVRGSPGLVINGTKVDAAVLVDGEWAQTYFTIGEEEVSLARNASTLLKIICSAFSEEPEACAEELSSETPSPGFGYEGTGTSAGGCGA